MKMVNTETLRDFFRVAIGTVSCLGIISMGRPDLFSASLKLGENVTVGLVPAVTLILALGGIFFGGYVFFIQCEVIIQVALARARRKFPR